MKKIVALLLAAVMVFGLAACGGGTTETPAASTGTDSSSTPASSSTSTEPAATPSGATDVVYDDGFGENVLRITYQAEPESADPACTTADYILMMNCMDTLIIIKTDENGNNLETPGLATEWSESADGLTYSFTLREGVKFSNGEEFTADDVLYSIDRMLQPERMGVNSSWYDMIAGAQDMLDGKIDTVENVGVFVKDDYHLDIVLADACATFLSGLSTPSWSIVNREAGDIADEAGGGAASSKYGSDPAYCVGTGPFILKEWVLNDHLYLEKNPDYWQGASPMDGIVIKIIPDAQTEQMLFDAGQIDIFDMDHALDLIPVYEASDYAPYMNYKTKLATSYLSINEKIEPLNDVRVRKALQMAIDRDAILAAFYYGAGTPATTFLAPGVPGYEAPADPIKYDPEGAKALLAEAGYADGFTLVITQTTDSSTSDIEVNEAIAAYFEAIGITVEIKQYDNATWYDVRATGELEMYRTSWTADFNDPDNFLYQMYGGSSNVRRSWNYYNEDAIARLEAARYMPNGEARYAEYTALDHLIILEDAAMIPLWHTQKVRVLQPRVKGFIPMWAGYGDCCYYGTYLE